LDDRSVVAFLSAVRWASLCFENEEGRLCALPARLDSSSDHTLVMTPAEEAAARGAVGSSACLVADEFETYEGIKGVIAQGSIEARSDGGDDRGGLVLRVVRRVGFGFAGTLPVALGGTPPEPAT
jgi:hypothetical protein